MDETSIRKYFNVFRFFMTAIGTWPYQSEISAKVGQTWYSLQHASIVLPEIIKLFESTHNADLMIESVPPLFYNVLLIIMFGNLIYHKPKTKQTLELILKDWESLIDEKERQILSNYADVGKMMAWMYIGSCFSIALLYCAFPLAPIIIDYITSVNESKQKMPLYRVEFFVDEDKYFYPILLQNAITTVLGVFAIINIDIYLATVTQHLCGMLTILSQLQLMNDTIKTSFGLLLTILVVLMSFTALVVLMKWGVWTEVIRFVLFTLVEVFHIFCYSYHSQMLIDHHEQFYNSIQLSGWYQSSIRTRRLILMMLLRCSKPFLIYCLIFPLSMENFTLIIKTSFSYFTVFRSTR